MEKSVTVVIPTVNVDRGYLKEAIESVLNQTVPCKLILERSDNSCAINLKNGTDKVDTEFFAILADDDMLDKNFVKKMIEGIGDADVCLCNAIQFNNEVKNKYKSTYTGFKELYEKNTIHGGAVLYRTSSVQGKYDPRLYCSEEYDLHLRLAFEDKRFTQIHSHLYYYRLHDGQKNKEQKTKRVSTIRFIRDKYGKNNCGDTYLSQESRHYRISHKKFIQTGRRNIHNV